jgi:hypothetical protein
MAMLVKKEKEDFMKFTVMYKVKAGDAAVVMDCACDSLSSLYRIVYAMAGKTSSIGNFEMFIAHQKLPNGDVIELDKEGFTRAIRATRLDDEARNEAAVLAAESKALTVVNPIPPMFKKDQAFDRKFFSVYPVTKAPWRKSYEPVVR